MKRLLHLPWHPANQKRARKILALDSQHYLRAIFRWNFRPNVKLPILPQSWILVGSCVFYLQPFQSTHIQDIDLQLKIVPFLNEIVDRVSRDLHPLFFAHFNVMLYAFKFGAKLEVNSLHHPNRQRFTIAHELGHLELHSEMITSTVHVDKSFPALMRDQNSATGTEKIEIEANQFASELLMPLAFIDEILRGKQFDIDNEGPMKEAATKFRVSRQALEYRIRNRGQI